MQRGSGSRGLVAGGGLGMHAAGTGASVTNGGLGMHAAGSPIGGATVSVGDGAGASCFEHLTCVCVIGVSRIGNCLVSVGFGA